MEVDIEIIINFAGLPLGRPRRRLMDNIRMDLGEVGWGRVDWIGLVQEVESSCEFGIELSGP
jgi:hypothetical protein